MNDIHSRFRPRSTWRASRLLAVGLCALFGWPAVSAAAPPQLATPPVLSPAAASSSQVPVDQSPLTIRKPIPPNIVLMLDDSGSMMWDVMPDWDNLSHKQIDLTDAKVNGVYYNPQVTYTPPPYADGTLYPAPAFSAAPVDGFDTDANRPVVDISSYDGGYDSSQSTSRTGGYPTGPSSINYSVAIVKSQDSKETAKTGFFVAPNDCPNGTDDSNHEPQYCFYSSDPSPKFFEFYDNVSGGTWYVSKCDKEGYIFNRQTKNCLVKDNIVIMDSCPANVTKLGTTTVDYNDNKDICVKFTADYFFTYSVDGVRHYVGKDGACDDAGLSADVCVDPSQTTPSDPTVQSGMSGADVLQNVANWFSYYHTRILMARSGVMTAFLGINPKYRVGFGSINGSGASWIQDNASEYYKFSTSTKSGNRLADVAAFGDGAAGTQKAKFWDWIGTKIVAKANTPLRGALKAVGMYYETKQPWASKNEVSGDIEYLACRQSYVILTTDGFWNGGNPHVDDQDDNAGDQITGPNNSPYTYLPVAPFMDDTATSNTLADVAMKYWKSDLMPSTGTPSMANEVPTNNADPAFWQHMVTFTMGMGYVPKDADGNLIDGDTSQGTVKQLFLWSQTGTKPTTLSNWGGWPEPQSDNINNIADLVHAGVNGHGGFYSATDPQSFVGGLKDALQRAQQRTGAGASVAANSTQLNTGTMIYEGIYHSKLWTGDLNAFAVDPDTGNVSTAPSWSAAAAMPAAEDRNIHTYVPGGTTWTAGSGTAVNFKNSSGDPSATPAVPAAPPNLSSAELAALGGDAAEQMAIVNYLRGDVSQNQAHNGPYRNRSTALGDIVDSQPVYLGAPSPYVFSGESFTGSSSYATFASTHADRTGLIYVAANDGMLHAFHARDCITRDATTGACTTPDPDAGKEVYAFLPAAVITRGGVDGVGNVVGVSELANPDYGIDVSMPHQFFNDGQLTIASAYFDGAWHSVLVGTTGRGMAKAVYALDVTDPANIKFLWERSAADGGTNSGYIGQMVGQPVIAQVADGKWVVLIGNGYNSANGVAALLQFKLSDGTLSVYKTGDTTKGNGLAAPAVWIGDTGTGISTVAYAGDLHGQVWSFQLGTSTGTGTKLFTAKDDDNNVQPITVGMLAGQDPTTGNRWIFFGTGRYLSSDDIADTSVQTWYGLIVDSPNNPSLVSNLADGRSALAKRAIIAQFPGQPNADPPVPPFRVVSPPGAPTPSIAGKSGWYIDLQTPTMNQDGTVAGYVSNGERMVVPSQFQRGRLVGTTGIPKSDDLCNPSGTGWLMGVDPFTGTNPKPPFFDVNGDGVVNGQDLLEVNGKYYAAAGTGSNAMLNAPIVIGSHIYSPPQTGEPPQPQPIASSGSTLTRVSWREMVNP